MNNRKFGIILVFIGIVLTMLPIVITYTKRDSNSNNKKEETFEVLGGTLSVCSRDNISEQLLQDENTNIVFSNENYSIDKDGNRSNNSSKISERHEAKGLVVENMTISSERCKEAFANISINITNNTEEDFENNMLVVDFIDKDGNITNSVYIEAPIKSGETKKITSKGHVDRIIDAYDYKFSIEEIKEGPPTVNTDEKKEDSFH